MPQTCDDQHLMIRKPYARRVADRLRRYNLRRRWRGRASKWHPGQPHHEVVCSYEEYQATQ
jgi:hypothetical protein